MTTWREKAREQTPDWYSEPIVTKRETPSKPLSNLPQLPQELHKPSRQMNKTESRYATTVLEPMRLIGDIVSYAYEPITLILGPRCTYRCDFVIAPAGMKSTPNRESVGKLRGLVLTPAVAEYMEPVWGLQFHETKGGFTRDDALVKIKAASQQFPHFVFKLCRYTRGQWDIRVIA